MIYVLILFLFIMMFLLSINRKRIPPKNHSLNYITSPVDGSVTNINLVELTNDATQEVETFKEIIIRAHTFSSPYLYMPIKGELKIVDKSLDNFIVDIINDNVNLKILHGWSFIINNLNYPILKDVQTYPGEKFQASEAYGRSLFVAYVKMLIPIKSKKGNVNLITTEVGQNLVAGESIICHENLQ